MIDLQSSLDGLKKGKTILDPARRFLSKGKVNFVNKKGEEIPAEFYLFSDIIVTITWMFDINLTLKAVLYRDKS